ncbi:MAG: hypothetical protein CMJ99_03815 [Planctomycetes bacterium]|nr:hypothetical protein [Planctomycetota bacterium]
MVFPIPESTDEGRRPDDNARLSTRRDGIALMVVMVVFVVLSMVVTQLTYYTAMEEQVARVRHGDIQGQDALYSVAQLVMAQLTEDLVQDYSEGSTQGSEGSTQGAALSNPAVPDEGAGAAGRAAGGGGGAGGRFVALETGPQGAVGAGGSSGNYDYLMEAIFNSQQHDVGEVKVKATIIDNERCFDLNRLFDYAPIPGEEDALTGPGGALSGEELAEMAAGTSGDTEAGGKSLSEQIRSRVGLINRDDDPQEAGEEANELENVAGLEDEVELTEFIEPTEEQQEATNLMLARAIEVMLSLNVDREFNYGVDETSIDYGIEHYNSDQLARDIIDYVLARRTSDEQNRIYHVTELLNIPSVTRELFYGPEPMDIPPEGIETPGGFLLHRDEFGDLASTFIYDTDQEFIREQEADALSGLMDVFPGGLPAEVIMEHGREFPGIGGLNANSLTRGMTGPAQVFDEEGYEYIEQPERPIGLREIFTTFSAGKININTASVPVLYALLLSLKEGNEEEAETVALQINDYRFEFQQFEGEEGVEAPEVGADALKDLGQPKRSRSPEEDELGEGLDLNSMVGLDEMGLASSGASAPMADTETNYFTNLEQIELVDGSAGDATDLLTSEVGVDRVDAQDDPLLQRVLNDYRNVMCFAGTYFTIELRAKTQGSPVVKSGIMVIKRNAQEKLMEVIFWKELQD